ncbi:MAG: bifunctional oligoribonuclease/PAP phosphatase NrnA [Ignavibacteriae bacterium]|nr:bifunctional oligoribonuclease/PAP phosphatase NrnA [Ignavibacteriota bacterium]
MQSTIEEVVGLFQQHQKFVLTTHVNPDGDGLGSEVALAEWLAGQGKDVSILNYSALPPVYTFLDPNHRISQFNEATDAATIAHAEVIVVLDTNNPERLRTMQPHVLKSAAIKICIDHHLEPAPFAHHYILDDNATSTGEIVYRMLTRRQPAALHSLIAQALYCAIMTDTGSFRYPRVDPEIHGIVAKLIEWGADPVSIYQQVYEQWSPGRIRLLGETLATLCTEHNGKLAHVTVTQDILQRTQTTEVDTENFTVYPMSVVGVVAGILFLEMSKGVKISFRSKGEIPINELAKEFGGNGHKNAAGARLYEGTIADTKQRVIRASAKYLQP